MSGKLLAVSLSAVLLAHAQETPPAQQPSDFKGVQRKKLAPVSNDVLRVKLPKPAESKLKNGMTLMVIEDHRAPTITVTLSIPASTYNEPADLPGLADATAELMRLGTQSAARTRDSRQIAETLADLGASLSVSAGQNSFDVRFTTLSENLDAVLELFADVLLHPPFQQEGTVSGRRGC